MGGELWWGERTLKPRLKSLTLDPGTHQSVKMGRQQARDGVW